MSTVVCPRCEREVALHEGRPSIHVLGSVELWHLRCWEERDAPLVKGVEPSVTLAVEVSSPPAAVRARRLAPRRQLIGGIAGAGLAIAIVIAQHAFGDGETSMVNLELPGHEHPHVRSVSVAREVPPPTKSLEELYPIPLDKHDVPLDESYPSLREWVHPVSGASEKIPANRGRHFGAERAGIERSECGHGHCGIDLDGPRGRGLVAVAAGVVVRIERREDGGDGMSGRFVRIQHDDGALTAYMHMDRIAPDLQTGDRVEQGQYIGTLGSTGVHRSVPHLHFSLELPKNLEYRGDVSNLATRFTDPAPFLVRSTIIPIAERRRAIKPAL